MSNLNGTTAHLLSEEEQNRAILVKLYRRDLCSDVMLRCNQNKTNFLAYEIIFQLIKNN